MTEPETRTLSLAALGRSALILTGAAVIVQVIGFVRQIFLAAEVGLSSGLDALLISMAAPLALVGVMTAGVQVALIPAYVDVMEERGARDARQLVGAVLLWTGLAGLAIAVALWVFADAVVSITGPGLSAAGTAEDAVRYLRQLSPLVVLTALTSILLAQLQAESLFPAMSLATVAGPFLTLAIMVYYWDSMGLEGLVVGTLVGAVVSLAIVAMATIVRRVPPVPRLLPRGLGIRGLVRHATPLSASAVILELNLVFDRAVASLLSPGGVSALRFGESLVTVPFAAIRPAWGTVVYPALVRARRGPDKTGFASTTERVLRYALVFFVPLAGLTIAVAPMATATAYERGAFSGADLTLTSQVVAVSAPLIVTWTIAPIMVSALNALRKGTVMLLASVVNVALNLVLNVVLGLLLGVVGVALATTIISIVMVAFFGLILARAEPSLSLRLLGRTFIRAALAILPAVLAFGVPIWAGLVHGDLVVRVLILAATGVAGLSSYYVLARRLGLEEAGAIVAFGTDSLGRLLARILSRT